MASLFIHSLRVGFATNSSSSHSLIYLPRQADRDIPEGHGYHDEHFVLASAEAKRPYVRLQLDGAGLAGELEELVGPPVMGQVNHQTRWEGSLELLRDVARWAMKEGVVVLGGGDGSPHPLLDWDLAIDPATFHYDTRTRRDPLGFWTVFDCRTGNRLRLSFAEAAHPRVLPFRATWPELVDLKITNRCSARCPFCYQDSRPDGAHAPLERIRTIVEQLQASQVLEVVLGGGEPTEHPDFAAILAAVQAAGMRVAFTTRRTDWLDRAYPTEVDWRRVGWALSVDSVADLAKAQRVRGSRRNPAWLPAIHVVLGTPAARPESLGAIAEGCAREGLRLVLLGFKQRGRAATTVPEDESHWVRTLQESDVRAVSIDTVLAERSELALRRAGIPPWLYDVEDGRFSMYLDAVSGLCGPSSYCEPELMFGIPDGANAIERAFGRINDQLDASRRLRALQLEQVDALVADDAARLVLLDAALEGRCERCGAAKAALIPDPPRRPRLVCPACAR